MCRIFQDLDMDLAWVAMDGPNTVAVGKVRNLVEKAKEEKALEEKEEDNMAADADRAIDAEMEEEAEAEVAEAEGIQLMALEEGNIGYQIHGWDRIVV
jgi:hypothetical protein